MPVKTIILLLAIAYIITTIAIIRLQRLQINQVKKAASQKDKQAEIDLAWRKYQKAKIEAEKESLQGKDDEEICIILNNLINKF